MPAASEPAASGGPEDDYTAEPFLPSGRGRGKAGPEALGAAAAECRGCPPRRAATQTVFGKGSASARLVLVGEQPGDQEDRVGEPSPASRRGGPMPGPRAGSSTGRSKRRASTPRSATSPTRSSTSSGTTPPAGAASSPWTSSGGTPSIHKAPSLRELSACGPWLAAELEITRPEVVVVLGASAGKALLGSSFRVTRERGVLMEREVHGRNRPVVATIHPSAVLRADQEDRENARTGLVSDLRVAAEVLRGS